MTDAYDFVAHLTRVLADNPRVTGGGCNTHSHQGGSPLGRAEPKTKTWIPDEAQVERFRKLVKLVEQNYEPHRTRERSSYSLKHEMEDTKWTEGTNQYVSNGEAIVAMLMCGYTPIWAEEGTNPNCGFRVDTEAKYKQGEKEAKRQWKVGGIMHSGQYEVRVNEDAGFGAGPSIWDAERSAYEGFRRGYYETKARILRNTRFCAVCMPDERYHTVGGRRCKSDKAHDVITRGEGWLEQATHWIE